MNAQVMHGDNKREKSSRQDDFFSLQSTDLPKPVATNLSLQQLLEEAAYVKKKDVEINAKLDELISSRDALTRKMLNLQSCTSKVISLDMNAHDLAENINQTSFTAADISKKIRELDTRDSRLKQALERVETVLDLKNTIEVVEMAIQSEDYEKAASQTYRILHESQGEEMKRSDEVSYEILVDLQNVVQGNVVKRCESALKEGKYDEAMYYSKLYAKLNLERDGLIHYCKAVQKQLSDRVEQDGQTLTSQPHGAVVPFLDIIPELFKVFVKCFKQHSSQVVDNFGGSSLVTLLEALQSQADILVAPFYQRFIEDRQLKRINRMIQSRGRMYQSHFHPDTLANNEALPDDCDPRKLEEVLEDIVFLCSECEGFSDHMKVLLQQASTYQNKSQEGTNEVYNFPQHNISEINVLIQQLLAYYVEIEQCFMLENVFKAMRIDRHEEGTKTSSMVDDVFFIVQKCAERAIATCSTNTACAVVNHINSALGGQFKQKLDHDLKEQIQQGADSFTNKFFQSSRNQVDYSKLFIIFNNMEVASSYMITLKDQVGAQFEETFAGVEDKHLAMIRSCLDDLSETSQLFDKSRERGIQEHVGALSPVIQESLNQFLGCSYELTESTFSENEASDPFVMKFIQDLQVNFSPVEDALSRGNFDLLIHFFIDDLIKHLEGNVMNKRFTFWGGLQFDKDMRSLISYFSGLCDRSVRDKFARLSQISSILQLQKVNEILDYWDDSESVWRFDAAEVKRILSLRIDFSSRAINKIRL